MNRLTALLPIHNEERNVGGILRRTHQVAHQMILVDDGSLDGTAKILDRFTRGRTGVYRLHLPTNRGMAGALSAGFRFALFLRDLGELSDRDILATLDADGQHRPEHLPEGRRRMEREGWDVLLTRRDFSVYPAYKVWGNRFLTLTNSVLSGYPYRDVESGMRFIRVSALAPILRYYTGYKYSCAQEIALLSARQGLKVSNDFEVRIDYYRPGTTVKDGFIVLALSFAAFLRWRLDLPKAAPDDRALFEASRRESRALWRGSRGR